MLTVTKKKKSFSSFPLRPGVSISFEPQPDGTVSLDGKDSCVLISGKPAIVKNFLHNGDKWMIAYQFFSDLQSFYTYPFPSDRLGIFPFLATCRNLL